MRLMPDVLAAWVYLRRHRSRRCGSHLSIDGADSLDLLRWPIIHVMILAIDFGWSLAGKGDTLLALVPQLLCTRALLVQVLVVKDHRVVDLDYGVIVSTGSRSPCIGCGGKSRSSSMNTKCRRRSLVESKPVSDREGGSPSGV